MKRFITAMILVFSFCLSVSVCHAVCDQSDLVGEWTAYLGFSNNYTYCDATISAGGVLVPGTSCVSGKGPAGTIKGGAITLDSYCSLSGKLTFSSKSHGKVTVTLKKGSMSDSKDTIVAACRDSKGEYFLMHAVKQPVY